MKITKRAVLAIASFVLLLLQALGLKIDLPVVNELISAFAGVLVVLGIVTDGGSGGDNGGGDTEGEVPSVSDEDDDPPPAGEGENGEDEEKNTHKLSLLS